MVAWRELDHPNWGGSEVLIDRVARGFVERDWEVSLLCAGPVGHRPYAVKANGGQFSQYVRAPFAGSAVRQADVVIDVSNGIPFFAPLWSRTPSVCLVHHIHGTQWHDALPRPAAALGWFLERRVVPRLYRRFWSVSPSTTDGLQKLGVRPDRIREIWNGVDVAAIPPEPSERSATPLFTVISRLVPHKGIDRVLDAWAEIGPSIGGQLVIIGDGPLRRELEARQTPATHFLGAVDDATKMAQLRRSWALIHGSHHEGWGIVVMEAAGVGVPTLAFDVPGIRDAVVHGETGQLATNSDDFARNWEALAVDPASRERMGDKAWERASALSWAACSAGAADMVESMAAGAW